MTNPPISLRLLTLTRSLEVDWRTTRRPPAILNCILNSEIPNVI